MSFWQLCGEENRECRNRLTKPNEKAGLVIWRLEDEGVDGNGDSGGGERHGEIGDLGRDNGIGCQGERKGKDQE